MSEDLLLFLLDEDLRTLARPLRLMGFDTSTFASESASLQSKLDQARDEFRTLVTPDRKTAEAAILAGSPRVILLESKPNENTDSLLSRFLEANPDALRIARNENFFFCRCVNCNTRTIPISKDLASDRVPQDVLSKSERFSICPRCEKVTWDGIYEEQQRRRFRALFQAISDRF